MRSQATASSQTSHAPESRSINRQTEAIFSDKHEPNKWGKLKKIGFAVWLSLVSGLLFFNIRLYKPSPLVADNQQTPPTLRLQLNANRTALDSNAANKMQQFFPEGYYFSYLFHGLTWLELAMREPQCAAEAIEQANWCLAQLDSPQARTPFPKHLAPNHGMFYSAWKCHLLAGIATIHGGQDGAQIERLRAECDALSDAIRNSSTPFLPSYTGSAWPCDSIPALHALSTYDRLTNESRYEDVIADWLTAAARRLDPETGLLPHTADTNDGTDVSTARATSQVIMLRLLPDINATFARDQYSLFRDRFVTTFLGAPCLLEYPSGISGPGDVDSGPLIFGRSLSATVLMMGVAQIYGDTDVANAIGQTGETVGLPWTSADQKYYMAGLLPIGDIMVAYAQVARPWFSGDQHRPDTTYPVASSWRLATHYVSLLIFLPLALPISRRFFHFMTGEPRPTSH
ncbi:MAG: hypothetical protein L7W43_10905 [Rubripirellula sp.]|nr:hypothetical protein [Rubripirellula sp.]